MDRFIYGLSGALKEAGDIANWYEVLEKRANFIKNKLDEKMKATDTKTQDKDPEIGKSEEIVSETKKTEDVKIRKNNFEEKEKTNSDSKEKDTNTKIIIEKKKKQLHDPSIELVDIKNDNDKKEDVQPIEVKKEDEGIEMKELKKSNDENNANDNSQDIT